MSTSESGTIDARDRFLPKHSHGIGFLKALHIAWMLAGNDIASRYRRTAIGPLWMIMTHGVWVGSIFILSTGIFGGNAREYLPYLAVSITFWNMLAYSVTGSTTVYQRSVGYISSFPFPLYTYPLQFQFSNLIVFLNQAIVPLIVLAAFGLLPQVNLLLLPAVLVIYLALGFNVSLIVGAFGARFRDVQYLLESVTTIMFLLTPIFWQKAVLVQHHWIVDYNPFAHLLSIARAAVLNEPAMENSWLISILLVVGTALVAALIYFKTRPKLYFWIQ